MTGTGPGCGVPIVEFRSSVSGSGCGAGQAAPIKRDPLNGFVAIAVGHELNGEHDAAGGLLRKYSTKKTLTALVRPPLGCTCCARLTNSGKSIPSRMHMSRIASQSSGSSRMLVRPREAVMFRLTKRLFVICLARRKRVLRSIIHTIINRRLLILLQSG
jgi:hypothetical protein